MVVGVQHAHAEGCRGGARRAAAVLGHQPQAVGGLALAVQLLQQHQVGALGTVRARLQLHAEGAVGLCQAHALQPIGAHVLVHGHLQGDARAHSRALGHLHGNLGPGEARSMVVDVPHRHLHVHQPELLLGEADHVEGQHALRGLAAQPLSVQARVPDGQLPVALTHSDQRAVELLHQAEACVSGHFHMQVFGQGPDDRAGGILLEGAVSHSLALGHREHPAEAEELQGEKAGAAPAPGWTHAASPKRYSKTLSERFPLWFAGLGVSPRLPSARFFCEPCAGEVCRLQLRGSGGLGGRVDPAHTQHLPLPSSGWSCAAVSRLRFYSRRNANHPSWAANGGLALAPPLRQPLTIPLPWRGLEGKTRKGK